MPTPRIRKPYNVIYSDGTYQTFDLTYQDLDWLKNALKTGAVACLSENVTLVTKDIRTIVPYVEPPAPPKPELTIPSELDDASKEWLQLNTSQFYEGEGRSFV